MFQQLTAPARASGLIHISRWWHTLTPPQGRLFVVAVFTNTFTLLYSRASKRPHSKKQLKRIPLCGSPGVLSLSLGFWVLGYSLRARDLTGTRQAGAWSKGGGERHDVTSPQTSDVIGVRQGIHLHLQSEQRPRKKQGTGLQ
ncbi:hypothetical protein EV126DRAFT_210506 [Verticillium dahliae]|nr:hypothetical protein EV126DRAFT_210506 [Verticillium dahliae]